MASNGNPNPRPLHVFFIPYFATGHMIPMVDIARLFAARGVNSTILVTPANAALISPTVDSAAAAGLPIRTLLYPFPSSSAVNLPPGAENLASVPLSDAAKIDAASLLTVDDHDRLLRLHRPDAVVSDTHFFWTTSIARDLHIPRISFHAIGLFPVCVLSSLFRHLPHLAVSDDLHPFLIPELPHPIHMVRSELPDFLRSNNTAIFESMAALSEAESGSLGVIVNSFSELESAYADYYYKHDNMRTWLVGPVADVTGKVSRGAAANPKAISNRERCIEWLEKQRERSVVYACFGSWCYFSPEQLREMALGLEMAGHPFLWVVREGDGEEWMNEGFEERVKEKGLVVRGWAPQVEVLAHRAVGGFVTHCGWNSVLEGVSSGLPMVTWPLSTEQFINEKLVVEVVGTAVRAWEGRRSTEEGEKEVVKSGDLAAAVEKVMGGGEEGEKRREKAREVGEMAKKAVDVGGSSYEDLSRLIQEIRDFGAGINGRDRVLNV